MLIPEHVRRFVIIPALAPFPERMRTPAAVELLLGTALKESRLTYLKQGWQTPSDGRGVALGLYQMEPRTYQDHVSWLAGRTELRALVFPHGVRPVTELLTDLILATRMARIHYWRVPAPLPAADDVEGMARYWGQYYQTQRIPEQMAEFARLYRQYAQAWG